MKSPTDLRQRLARQWQQANLRTERLLQPDGWPLKLPIGKPTARLFAENTAAVQQHVQQWQAVKQGEVQWEPVNYRAGVAPVRLPVYWVLRSPSEWVAAAADREMLEEFKTLELLVSQIESQFHPLLIRQRALWRAKSVGDVVHTARLATTLTPGCANGRPLRLLAEFGVDTKFFERNGGLLTRLLDERFDGAASEQGLPAFLDALEDKDHWLLLASLDDGLLPFKRQRVTATELANTPLPGARLLVVENEHCLHLLPRHTDTIAILGAGLNLQWLQSPWLEQKTIAYWGDMDSWGLQMLAQARQYQPLLLPLLMNRPLFDQYAPQNAVPEPVTAQTDPPAGLTEEEAQFYRYLIGLERGRLEQEFLPAEEVFRALADWVKPL